MSCRPHNSKSNREIFFEDCHWFSFLTLTSAFEDTTYIQSLIESYTMDFSDPVPLLKAFAPKIPLVGKTILSHTLGLSATSSQWDLRTELTVKVIKSFVTNKPSPISKTQHVSLKAPAIKGKIWIAKTTAPVPAEDSLRETLFKAIEDLKDDDSPPLDYVRPDYAPVEAEWTGYRGGATKASPELRISEAEKYTELMKEATSPTTILYFHGGAYYLMDPATHRPTCQKLARITKGRCYSVRYRLSPQHAFPAALLDALVSYFTLLHPPPGSFHAPVKPEHIVFSGDSAGGNLATVLFIALAHLHTTGTKIHWHGNEIDVPLPAGLALNSPWLDVTLSSPSCETNGKWDYLPSKLEAPDGVEYPSDALWPPKPPYKQRKLLYADDCLVTHPLVSPLGIKLSLWKRLAANKTKWFFCYGDELLQDDSRHVAGQLVRTGADVVAYEWEAMPHCFAMVFEGQPNSRRCFDLWGGFIAAVVQDSDSIKTKGVRVGCKDLDEKEVVVETLCSYEEEAVRGRIRAAIGRLSQKEADPLSKL